MHPSDGPEDSLDTRGEAGFVRGALEDAGAHPGTGDPLLDVVEKELVERIDMGGLHRRRPKVKVVRQVVVRVEAGSHDDVEVHLGGDLLHEIDVSPQADDGQVHDRPDSGVGEPPEAPHRIGDPCVPIPSGRPVSPPPPESARTRARASR